MSLQNNRDGIEMQAFNMLMIDEGISYKPYVDTVGKVTIGIGRNLTDRGITEATVKQMFWEDLGRCFNEANEIFSYQFEEFSRCRQLAILNMLFNLGKSRFLGFTKMINAIRSEMWAIAAREALDSKWAHQVGARADRIADLFMDKNTY